MPPIKGLKAKDKLPPTSSVAGESLREHSLLISLYSCKFYWIFSTESTTLRLFYSKRTKPYHGLSYICIQDRAADPSVPTYKIMKIYLDTKKALLFSVVLYLYWVCFEVTTIYFQTHFGDSGTNVLSMYDTMKILIHRYNMMHCSCLLNLYLAPNCLLSIDRD